MTIKKLLQAEEKLGYALPKYLFDFIAKLIKPEVQLGHEKWFFWTVTDQSDDPEDNFIITYSADFYDEWGVNGFVFAANGLGDYLALLRDEQNEDFLPQVFVMMHETAELKVFAANWDDLIKYGPDDYIWTDEFYLKLDDNNKPITGSQSSEVSAETENINHEKDFFDDDYALRSKLDDLIDDERTDLAGEIIRGLKKLTKCDEEFHKIWALNKLSDIYLKGFGAVQPDMDKDLKYNQLTIDLDSHVAYSNRAACYFFGLGGLSIDLDQALAFATKANDLSKSNMFADIFATKSGGGMYDRLVDMIKGEIRKRNN